MRKMKAAIMYSINQPLKVEEVEIEDPGPGQVLVKVKGAGVCHSDLSVLKGYIPTPVPVVLGHEGAGVVEEVGEGVTRVKKGDHVILFSIPSCGKCVLCTEGKPFLCLEGWQRGMSGTMFNGRRKLRKGGEEINHSFCQSSYAQYCLVEETMCIKVREDAPLDKVCILADCVLTGAGAVFNTVKVDVGATVAIFGCGGIGCSAILGARTVGAGKIIAVDIQDMKLKKAREFGADYTINSSAEDPVKKILEITEGLGVDYAFEVTGIPKVMEQAFESIRIGGTAVIIGVAPAGAKISIDAMSLLYGRKIVGSTVGSVRPALDIPRYANLYMDGLFPIDKLITKTLPLEQINQAFEAMEKGEIIRSVIVP